MSIAIKLITYAIATVELRMVRVDGHDGIRFAVKVAIALNI